MKSYINAKILSNEEISENIYSMTLLAGSVTANAKEGQFIEIYPANHKNILPRPFSICDIDKKNKTLRIVYEVKGEGTTVFSHLEKGEYIKILGPLGNGYTIEKGERIGIIGGGVGIPPLLWLTKSMVEKNTNASIEIFLGYRDVPYLAEDFQAIKSGYNDVEVFVSTDSGKEGFHGNVLDLIKGSGKSFDIIYACGPKPMLKAITEYADKNDSFCQISAEERMACGIGACVGCVIKIKDGNNYVYKKVCKDGPVFDSKEVVFDD